MPELDFGDPQLNENAAKLLAAHRARTAAAAATPATPTTEQKPTSRISLPCFSLGDLLPVKPESPNRKYYQCEHPDQPLGPEACSCKGCGPSCRGYAISAPDRITRIDASKLVPVADGRQFNASIVNYCGLKVMAYRTAWRNSEIHIAELGSDLQPTRNVRVSLPHPKCSAGREDPRLFVFRERLWLAFTALQQSPRGGLMIAVMLAELGSDYQPVRIFEPRYGKRKAIEKNWTPFVVGEELYLSYTYSPHRVLRVDVDSGAATEVHETACELPWSGGSIRGGAPGVLADGEYVHWFHGWHREHQREYYRYSVGVLATEAVAPFRITRITSGPVWLPDSKLNSFNITRDKTVIYPCGAILDGPRWLVSTGQADSVIDVGEFDADEISRLMVRV